MNKAKKLVKRLRDLVADDAEEERTMDSDREAFEKWFCSKWPEDALREPWATDMWTSWQAALRTRPAINVDEAMRLIDQYGDCERRLLTAKRANTRAALRRYLETGKDG